MFLHFLVCVFFSSRRRHTRWPRDWSSDVCSSDLDVFLAERIDQNFHQNVALKVIRDKDTTGKELLRFEQERLILSKLSHPNTAKFLDGGISDEGRAYYVMEFVDGIPLTE